MVGQLPFTSWKKIKNVDFEIEKYVLFGLPDLYSGFLTIEIKWDKKGERRGRIKQIKS